ncbi:hypothetical protein O181_002331 [Austropuccinia psidii MF-1]|uniref:Uncharacterized protein n=1 Tax=Austropuccinia psidii MF-1 TaxID=1389203 RepID=A0A9Q3BBR1_9BASI|nr:hypothetical protein [Austropuccinia psidii MF-1]
MESQQEVQAPGGEGNQDKKKSSHYPSYRETIEPARAYSDSPRLKRSRPTQLSTGFTPFSNQTIRSQKSPFFTIPGSYQEKTRMQREIQDLFQPQAERVRLNDPESAGYGKRSTQEPEIALNTSRISSPTNRNITPTQNKPNIVIPESNLNSDQLWLQISQFAVQTQEIFD